jgi:DtxR family Mn-dependent transcriptional regulator
MRRTNLSQSTEDYLKIIYDLIGKYQRASTNQIAERLGVTPASVSGMIKRLASSDPPLLRYEKHHGVKLTEQGEQAALEVIRHHRLLELFLYQNLGYTWDEVHNEADRLEHVISEEFVERMAQSLGDPLCDPHGEPIPQRDLSLPKQSSVRLSDLRLGQRATIQRVYDTEPELLRYLSKIGLVPRANILVIGYSSFDDNLRLQVNGKSETLVLGPRVTQQIYVEVQ